MRNEETGPLFVCGFNVFGGCLCIRSVRGNIAGIRPDFRALLRRSGAMLPRKSTVMLKVHHGEQLQANYPADTRFESVP